MALDQMTATPSGTEIARPPADRWYSEKRLGGLSRFAFAITFLNIVGHFFLGFEQSWLTPLVGVFTAYGTELVGETIDAAMAGRPARYAGGPVAMVKFLLSAHITGLAVAMLLYPAENVAGVAFAVAVAIASKYVFRLTVRIGKDGKPVVRHVLNPSNFGITLTLILFPTVGIAPPYQFTENTWGIVDWILPLIIVATGSLLNSKATGRMPLIGAWVVFFAVQAVARALFNGTPVDAELIPMTGFAFVLFTFYMITDPATSPARLGAQVGFAAAVAFGYAVFMELHIVFGLFYALTAVTAIRGGWLAFERLRPLLAARMAARRVAGLSPAE